MNQAVVRRPEALDLAQHILVHHLPAEVLVVRRWVLVVHPEALVVRPEGSEDLDSLPDHLSRPDPDSHPACHHLAWGEALHLDLEVHRVPSLPWEARILTVAVDLLSLPMATSRPDLLRVLEALAAVVPRLSPMDPHLPQARHRTLVTFLEEFIPTGCV